MWIVLPEVPVVVRTEHPITLYATADIAIEVAKARAGKFGSNYQVCKVIQTHLVKPLYETRVGVTSDKDSLPSSSG